MFSFNIFPKEKGLAMLPAIIVLSLIILAIAASMMTSGFIESLVSRTLIESQESFYLSDSGIDDALLKIARDRTLGEDILSEPWSLPTSGSSAITVLGTATSRVINSVGIISEKQRSLETSVTLNEYGEITATTWEELIGIWYSLSWPYRKEVTFTSDSAKIPSTQTDFPVLINLSSDVDLAADAQDDGDDIFFTSYDGLTKLNHEIEKFDGATGELVAWVKVPSLSINTIIYMYYGDTTCESQQNVTGAWDGNFVMIQHLKETSRTVGVYNDHLDSTSNDNDGEAEMEEAHMDTTGQINGADDFDGINDYVDFGDVGTAKTLEFWINPDTTSETVLEELDDTGVSILAGTMNYPSWDNCYVDGADTDTITAGWHHVVLTSTTNVTMSAFRLGLLDATYLDGSIDEVRVSDTARSANWITTGFNNQDSPSTFYTLLKEIH